MFNELGEVVRAKVRLVARWCKQREGIDFLQNIAPTAMASCSFIGC